MKKIPASIGSATVISYTPIDGRHKATEKTRHIVGGQVQSPMAGLAICQYPEDSGYYLFYCDADWTEVTDTWHASIEDAKHQAEFEYEGSSKTWIDAAIPAKS